MKNKIIGAVASILVIGLVAFALNSRAENVGLGVGTPSRPLSVTVSNTSTSTTTGSANVANATKFAVQVTSVSGSANLSNTVVTINRSVNGTDYLGLSTITLANTGTTAVNCISNYTGQADTLLQFIVSSTALTATNTVNVYFNQLDQ